MLSQLFRRKKMDQVLEKLGGAIRKHGIPTLPPRTVIYASPTTGKTTLKTKLESEGIVVIDTDDVIREWFPWYFRDRAWIRDDLSMREMRDTIYVFVALIVRLQQPKFVLTNIASSAFWRILIDRKSPELVVIRSDVKEVDALASQRKDPISVKLIKKWISGALFRASAAKEYVDLKKGEYLADVVSVKPQGFVLKDAKSTMGPE